MDNREPSSAVQSIRAACQRKIAEYKCFHHHHHQRQVCVKMRRLRENATVASNLEGISLIYWRVLFQVLCFL